VPLSARALAALDDLPPRSDSRFVFPASRGGAITLDNFRRRQWGPAIEASGVSRPARIYDLRSTFASNALAAGVSVFELARIMGSSVKMIEHHYGTLIEGTGADIARRLDAFNAEQDQAREGVEAFTRRRARASSRGCRSGDSRRLCAARFPCSGARISR
jgi:integrase